jgi:diphthamide synthase (EF-2-diphthine--ammonia ligase)
MHGVPFRLLEEQARALGLPLEAVATSPDKPYESALAGAVAAYAARGVARIAYGDLFLADIRKYREALHARIGMECLFPLWGRETGAVARGFLDAGYAAIVACVDARKLDIGFAGRPYDEAFLRDLPAGVDPAGENGEFHTFVHAGPLFREPVRFRAAEPVRMTYTDVGHAFELGFCDLSPLAASVPA